MPTPGLISAHSSLDCTPPGEPCAATPLSVSDMPGLGFLLPPLLPSSPPLSHSTLPCKNLQSRALEKGIHRTVSTSHIFPRAHFPPTLSPLPPPSPSTISSQQLGVQRALLDVVPVCLLARPSSLLPKARPQAPSLGPTMVLLSPVFPSKPGALCGQSAEGRGKCPGSRERFK